VVVAANHTIPPTGTDVGNEAKYNSGHCLLSDDKGRDLVPRLRRRERRRLHQLQRDHRRRNSPDGRVYFNTRNDSPSPGNRADAYSEDGGRTLVKPFRPQAGLTAPRLRGQRPSKLHDPDVLLYSGPRRPGRPAP